MTAKLFYLQMWRWEPTGIDRFFLESAWKNTNSKGYPSSSQSLLPLNTLFKITLHKATHTHWVWAISIVSVQRYVHNLNCFTWMLIMLYPFFPLSALWKHTSHSKPLLGIEFLRGLDLLLQLEINLGGNEYHILETRSPFTAFE